MSKHFHSLQSPLMIMQHLILKTTWESKCSLGLHFTAKETEIFTVGQELVCPQHNPKAGHLPSHEPSAGNIVPDPSGGIASVFLTNLPGLLIAQILHSLKQMDDKTQAIVLNQQSLLCSPLPNVRSLLIAPWAEMRSQTYLYPTEHTS